MLYSMFRITRCVRLNLYTPNCVDRLGNTSMELQTALTRETATARFIEFATLDNNSITRTQIEMRDGLVFMRAKRRTYVFS